MGDIFHRDSGLGSLRYPSLAPLYSPSSCTVVETQFCIGPLNDLVFLDYPRQIDPNRCGPFNSERDFMEAIAEASHTIGRQGRIWCFRKDTRSL
jgi:hypothetical protein